MNAIRWGLVTATISFTAGTLGHYLPGGEAFAAIFLVSVAAAAIGSASISIGETK